jgi:diguanylate cyclase (GGDEF)-like protein
LTAQGDMIGLFYLEEKEGQALHLDASRLYLELIAENVGLAIANLQLREKLTLMAIEDPLTGLFNRRYLDERVQRFASDELKTPLACLMIDIDHFKRFNDEYGHDAGDKVMQYVGRTLRDTLGDHGEAYRYGGEEFTALLPGMLKGDAAGLAEKVRTAVSGTAISHAGKLLGTVTISVGVATSPEAGPLDTLLARADAALLLAKAQGRNRVVAS